MATLQKDAIQTPYPTTTKKRPISIDQRNKIWGWIFLSPWIIGFLFFYLLPMVVSLLFSFTDLNLSHPDEAKFVGLDNYAKLLEDPNVGKSLLVTLRYAVIALPFSIAIPLFLAILLNSKYVYGKPLLRTLFYMPYIVPIISITYIFNGFLNAESGWLNRFLENFGVRGPDWLYDPFWIYPALFIVGLWGVGNYMLILLAGLQTVPTELYDAAKVDGANGMVILFRITLPLISPVIFYVLILSLIGLFRYFEIPYILSRGTGGPNDLTLFYNLYFYRITFRFQEMGFGSAMAWLLFAIVVSVTSGFFATSRFWVYYAGERD